MIKFYFFFESDNFENLFSSTNSNEFQEIEADINSKSWKSSGRFCNV
jgi:hypothetical protein